MADLGAGTGRFALAAAAQVARVVAVDVSPAMLAVLRDRVARAGVANVECVRAGFLTYEHTGPPADAVFTRNALHQLPDFWKALALDKIARLLRPGGVLRLHDLIFDCQPAEAGAVAGAWLEDAAEDPSLGYTRDRPGGRGPAVRQTPLLPLESWAARQGDPCPSGPRDRTMKNAQ